MSSMAGARRNNARQALHGARRLKSIEDSEFRHILHQTIGPWDRSPETTIGIRESVLMYLGQAQKTALKFQCASASCFLFNSCSNGHTVYTKLVDVITHGLAVLHKGCTTCSRNRLVVERRQHLVQYRIQFTSC